MPSTYAHRRFGADVLQQLPAALQDQIGKNRALFDVGLHGPDLLFYYHAAKSNPVSALGNAMHEQPGRVFFERARGVVRQAKDRDAALAYALGFVCHFALDSTCHPYVEAYTHQSGVSHCEIETEAPAAAALRRGQALGGAHRHEGSGQVRRAPRPCGQPAAQPAVHREQ